MAGHRLSSTPASRKTIPATTRTSQFAHQGERADWQHGAHRVENPGVIYDAKYLTLRRLSDEVFLLPGVARMQMKSLWTPSTRWVGVTEDGLEGGPVIPDGYDGSPASLERLRANISRSGELGQLVALDARSSVIFVPLLAKTTGGAGHGVRAPARCCARSTKRRA
jgi:hypothetical protein